MDNNNNMGMDNKKAFEKLKELCNSIGGDVDEFNKGVDLVDNNHGPRETDCKLNGISGDAVFVSEKYNSSQIEAGLSSHNGNQATINGPVNVRRIIKPSRSDLPGDVQGIEIRNNNGEDIRIFSDEEMEADEYNQFR